MLDMSKQRLTDCLDKSRELLAACVDSLTTQGPVDTEGLAEALEMVRTLLQAAETELTTPDTEEYTQEDEELYTRCLSLVLQEQKASTALLQRRLSIGYARAARLMHMLTEREIISPAVGSSSARRKVLLPPLP